jgi:hypothetical protein
MMFSVDDYQPVVDLLIDGRKIYIYLLTYFVVYFFYLIFLILNNPNNDDVYVDFMQKNCMDKIKYTPFLKCFVDSADYFGFLGTLTSLITEKIKYKISDEPSKIIQFIAENLNEDNKSCIGNWNNTSILCSFSRFFIIFIESYFLLYSFKYISFLTNQYLITFFMFEKAIPSFLVTFLLFNFMKNTTIWLKISNIGLNDENHPQFIRKQSSKKALLNNH